MSHDTMGVREFLHACASGDTVARRHFQEQYGEDIYHFPVKIYGTPLEEAGDYYLYVFDQDRIFIRLKTFAGHKSIQFRTFLSYYVLKHLFLEWRRTRKEIDMISLQTPIEDSSDGNRTLEDLLPDTVTSDSASSDQLLTRGTTNFLNSLAPEDRLLLKLLSLVEYNLSPEEVRLLATISGRTIRDTLPLLAEIHDNLTHKDKKVARLCDELDSVWGWIVLRQKELQEINQQLYLLSTVENIVDTEKLLAPKHALEQTLAKRIRQHERLVEELRTYKLTTPYRDIAQLLNSTTSSVYSRLFRLREQLAREFCQRGALGEYVRGECQ
jgi:DNA-directed RNA polymerase specialized sigma24 family protein